MTFPVRVAVQIQPADTPDYATWRQAVLHAEEIGVDVIFGYDHFHAPFIESIADAKPVLAEVQPDVNNFEGWTALASWGEITTRAELGLLVAGIGYRNPDLLADMARTVDHISGGRVILGVGAGWYEKDYTTYGFDYGTVKSRVDLFDEGLLRIERRFRAVQPPPLRKIPILDRRIRSQAHLARGRDAMPTSGTPSCPSTPTARPVPASPNWPPDSGAPTAISSARRCGPIRSSADAYLAAGATLFHTEVRASEGKYDLSTVQKLVDWRDTKR